MTDITSSTSPTQPTKAGWRIPEWCSDVGCCRTIAYELLRDKKIKSVRLGTARIITTAPAEFLASLAGE